MAFRAVVPSEVQAQRMNICEACKWFKDSTKSCGTLITQAFKDRVGEVDAVEVKGNVVRHYRKPIKLCGCYMPAKTELAWASCPAEKWGTFGLGHKELARLKTIALELKRTGRLELGSEKAIMFKLYLSKLTGKNVELTNCPSCINELLELSLSATAEIEIE